MAGYAELMDLVFSSWRDIPFNENHVKQLHQILLRHSEKDSRHRGQYKTNSNSVAAFDENGVQIGIVFETASPFDTPRLMAELVAWVNGERDKAQLHPLLIIAIFVVVFLEIHPFQDGNGRLSRVLTTLLLIQAGYAYVPYSSLESVIELNKEAYYLALRQTQGSIRTDAPNWQPWLVFFLRSLAEQYDLVDEELGVAGQPQRGVQHGAILGDVDVLAAEHRGAAPRQVDLVGEPQQGRDDVVGDEVLGEVHAEVSEVEGELLRAARVGREPGAEVGHEGVLERVQVGPGGGGGGVNR